METLAGELSVKEACEQLGISPSQFANLRAQAIQSLVDGLEPKAAGRPRRASVISERELETRQRLADLERENRLLRTQLEVVAIRTEDRRSKSDRPAAKRPASPRSDAAGGAVS